MKDWSNFGGTYASAGSTGSIDVEAVDLTGLPKEFNDEDFDIVAKEAWLLGFWFHRATPGRIDVCIETDWGDPYAVTVYRKRWGEGTWKARINSEGKIF
jgi:hypothetical protein